MSDRDSMIRCVYCLEEKPKPSKGEHIVLDGLGGRVTTKFVCGDCNQFFGNGLDREFLRNGLVALHRYFDPAITEGRVDQTQFVSTEFGFVDVHVLNSQQLDVLPQVGALDTRIVVVAAEPDRQLVDSFLTTFGATTVRLHRDIRDREEHTPARVVIARRGNKHLLRARSEAEAGALLALLSRPATPSGWKDLHPDARISLRLSVDVNVPGRCAAKMAFNLAAEVLGAELLLSEAFDGVRAYIRGTDVQEGPAIAPNGNRGVRIDQRFVDPWMGQVHERTLSAGHAILLADSRGLLVARVVLFQGIEAFQVRLGQLGTGNADPLRPLMALWSRPDGDWWLPPNGFPWRHDEPPIGSTLSCPEGRS